MARLAACLLLCAGTLAMAAPSALANSAQKSILMDDNALIYDSQSNVEHAMVKLRSLGVDVVKVSLVWSLVAPGADAKHKPDFNATDPNAYPQYAWSRYDYLVELAQKLGLTVYFQLTAPAPRWAVTNGPDGAGTHLWSRLPNAKYFGQFAQAAGKRYSGHFVPPGGAGSVAISDPLTGVTLPRPAPGTQPTVAGALPAVRWWSLWNEPNEQGWLSPQFHTVYHHNYPWAPLQWRNLEDYGYTGLKNTGHANDTILIGETSAGGAVHPVPFVQDLYCLGSTYQPLRGTKARAFGCPTSGSRAAFVRSHAGLFHVKGYGDHPYSFGQAPNAKAWNGSVTMSNLGVLERALGRIRRAYGQRGNLPIYITEYGYKSNPPNPYVHNGLTQQATWINQAEYLSWRLPYVYSFAQFELRDDRPRTQYRRGSVKYWSTFQTGIEFQNGKPKPSYAAYRIPIWMGWQHPGRSVAVWGEVRPANHATRQTATIQFRTSSHAKWGTLATVHTHNSQGYLMARVRIRRPGMLRLEWVNPGSGAVDYSRTLPIRR
jgi:hypothetical protein